MSSSRLPDLLQAKLQTPTLRPSLVARPRLTEKLTQGLAARLLLISAPAGYGKTTLVADWSKQLTIDNHQLTIDHCSWLSLDERDNDPARFLTYLIAALEKFAPHCGEIARSQLPQPLSVATALTNSLTDNLSAAPYVLVLDDYHLISSATIHEALALLIDHAPPSLHITITTREDPPLPLARWRARGQLVEIRAADLRFTTAEAATFLEQVMGLSLAAEEINAVESRTEGWAAGLQLAALALEGETERNQSVYALLDQLSGESSLIANYLLAEVFARQTAATQRFLLDTSILERLSAPLCAAVLAGPAADSQPWVAQAQAQLEQLHLANLFLVSLDNRGEWFQYHQLFREFLWQRLQRTQPEREPLLHQAAAHWLQQAGQTTEAVSHWLLARQPETAAPLIAGMVLNHLHRGEIVTVRNWLEQLPEALILQQPTLALARLWLFASVNQPAAIASEGPQLAAQLAAQSEQTAEELPLAAETLAVMAVGAAMTYDAEKALALARQAEAQPGLADPFARAHVTFALAAAYKVGGSFHESEQHFRQSEALASLAGADYLAFSAVANLASLQLEWGRLVEAEASCRHALRLLQASPTSDNSMEKPHAGWIYWTLGTIAYYRNDLDLAQQYADRSVPLCEIWGNHSLATFGQLLRARLAQTQGDLGAAQSMLDYAARLARQSADQRLSQRVLHQRLSIALQQHDHYAARHWLELIRSQGSGRFRFRNHLAEARFALAEGQPETTLHHTAAARQELESVVNVVSARIQALTLEALAYHALGQRPQAQQSFEQALALGEPGNFIRPLADEGQAVAALLASTTAYPDYVGRLAAAFALPAAPAPSPNLTPREQEILRLLALGLSNREMAEQLVIAESTLKRHLSNLYLKLDVHSRTQALAAIKS